MDLEMCLVYLLLIGKKLIRFGNFKFFFGTSAVCPPPFPKNGSSGVCIYAEYVSVINFSTFDIFNNEFITNIILLKPLVIRVSEILAKLW
jgi:hypothetical protein